jgi:hypothetical protein
LRQQPTRAPLACTLQTAAAAGALGRTPAPARAGRCLPCWPRPRPPCMAWRTLPRSTSMKSARSMPWSMWSGCALRCCTWGSSSLICTPPPAGHGQVRTAHGLLPLPAPAVLEYRTPALTPCPLAGSEAFPAAELTTPTGLALAACWTSRFGVAPALLPRQVGVGLGSRSLDRRPVAAGAGRPRRPPRDWTRHGGVQQQPPPADRGCAGGPDRRCHSRGPGLSGRPAAPGGSSRCVQPGDRHGEGAPGPVAQRGRRRSEQLPALRRVWWRHSSSLGLREQQQQRWALQRRQQRPATPPWARCGCKSGAAARRPLARRGRTRRPAAPWPPAMAWPLDRGAGADRWPRCRLCCPRSAHPDA